MSSEENIAPDALRSNVRVREGVYMDVKIGLYCLSFISNLHIYNRLSAWS
jgi:hypothetical protein